MFQTGGDLADLTRHRPIQALDLGTSLQIDNTMTEQIQRLLAYLLRIVPGFQHTTLVQLIPNLIQFMHKFMVGFTHFKVFIHFGKRSCFQHLKYQNGMMGSQRTPALRYDIWMRDAVLVTDIDHCGNRVIHIFLDRIIDTALAIGRTGTVVIDSQPAANIHKLDIEAHRVQLHIELRRFAQSRFDTTYLGHLTADMEMDQLQAIRQIFLFQEIKCFQ